MTARVLVKHSRGYGHWYIHIDGIYPSNDQYNTLPEAHTAAQRIVKRHRMSHDYQATAHMWHDYAKEMEASRDVQKQYADLLLGQLAEARRRIAELEAAK